MVTQAAFPGNFLVDIVPALKYLPTWFPGARGFNEFAARGRDMTRRAMWIPFEHVKEAIVRALHVSLILASAYLNLNAV